jgi:YVTN family beta-propeller protein
VIDTASNTVTATVFVGSTPEGIAITPDGAFAYVTNLGSGNVSVIDTATNSVTATATVGSFPDGVAITPDGAFAYVTNRGPDNVSVIETASNTVTTTVNVGDGPTGVAITPDGAFAYITNVFSGDVSVIDTASNTVTATVIVGSFPDGVAITPARVDADADGVPDALDQCPVTVVPESAPTSGTLGQARYSLIRGVTFSMGPKAKTIYTTTDTAGCSCEQIVAALGLGKGHLKFGCSKGAMEAWIRGFR